MRTQRWLLYFMAGVITRDTGPHRVTFSTSNDSIINHLSYYSNLLSYGQIHHHIIFLLKYFYRTNVY